MPNDPVEWAFDTETQDGRAVLIGVAGPNQFLTKLAFPRTWGDCFDFLSSCASKFTAFNMDYDVRALLKFLPPKIWTALYTDERAWYDCRGRSWNLTYRAGREFVATETTKKSGQITLHVFDVQVFFQTSLAKAAPIVGHKKLDVPRTWIKRMGDKLAEGALTGAKIVDYCLRDAMIARDLWAKLDKEYRAIGVPAKTLAHPISPGSIAAGYFGDRVRFKVPPWANWTAKKAYAGGRIEVYKRGFFPHVWAYDLKSAYPWVLSTLPDPRKLIAISDESMRSDAVYGCFKVKVNIPPDVPYPPIATWSASNVRIYPAGRFTAWVTRPELDLLASRRWLEGIEKGVQFVGERKPWLKEIGELFLLRKSKPEISLAIKLVLNSIYGKLAQTNSRYVPSDRVDSKSRKVGGKFVSSVSSLSPSTHFAVASYVTALCRLALFDAMESHPGRVILSATDGVLMTCPMLSTARHELGESMGQWSTKLIDGRAIVVGTGVYALQDRKTRAWEDHYRGFRLEKPLRTVLDVSRPTVLTTNRIAYTLADAVTKKDVEMNVIKDMKKRLDVNFDDKRDWPCSWKSSRDLLSRSMDSRPLILLEGR